VYYLVNFEIRLEQGQLKLVSNALIFQPVPTIKSCISSKLHMFCVPKQGMKCIEVTIKLQQLDFETYIADDAPNSIKTYMLDSWRDSHPSLQSATRKKEPDM